MSVRMKSLPFPPSIPQETVLSLINKLTNVVQFSGGYLWQYWLSMSGPLWTMKIIRDREKVQNPTCHRIRLIFDMLKARLILDLDWQVGLQLGEEMSFS